MDKLIYFFEAFPNKRKAFYIFIGLIFSIEFLFIFTMFEIMPTLIMISNNPHGSELSQIQSILNYVTSTHKYTEDIYDCSEFSRDTVYMLKLINISAYCVTGEFVEINGKSYKHTWVETIIDNQTYGIEATNGYIIDDKEYKERYKPSNYGVCA